MMRRFRFRLERLLALRHQQVTAVQRRLAADLAQQAAAEQRLDGLRLEHARQLQRLPAIVGAADLAQARGWLSELGRQLQVGQADLVAAQTQVARRRQELAAARQRERVLELLRDRRHAEHQQQLQREEQAELDEIGVRATGLTSGG